MEMILLKEELLPDMRNISKYFIFQQDSMPGHRVKETVDLLSTETPTFIPPTLWPLSSLDLNPDWSLLQEQVYKVLMSCASIPRLYGMNLTSDYYIRKVNGVKLAEIMFSLLCVCLHVCLCALSPIAWKVENISIRTIYHWSKWGLRRNVQKCNTMSVRCSASSLAAASCYARQGYNVMGRITYFRQKYIRIVHEKLRIFPYGQYIVGNVVLLAFWRCIQFQDRSEGWGEKYKNVTPFPMDFLHPHSTRAWSNDVIIIGRRLLCMYITREARM